MKPLVATTALLTALVLNGCATDGAQTAPVASQPENKMMSCANEARDKNMTGDMRRLYIESCMK